MKLLKLITVGLCLAGSSLLAAADNIITNADFTDGFEGWKISGFVGGKPGTDRDWQNTAIVFRDSDNKNALRVACQDADGMGIDLTTEPGIPLDPAWIAAGRLKISFKAKMTGFVQGDQPWGRSHVWVIFYNDEEKQVGEHLSGISNDIPKWKFFASPIEIPADATNFKVKVGFIVAMGELEVRDLTIIPLPAAK